MSGFAHLMGEPGGPPAPPPFMPARREPVRLGTIIAAASAPGTTTVLVCRRVPEGVLSEKVVPGGTVGQAAVRETPGAGQPIRTRRWLFASMNENHVPIY
jgi:hypothetical protein